MTTFYVIDFASQVENILLNYFSKLEMLRIAGARQSHYKINVTLLYRHEV